MLRLFIFWLGLLIPCLPIKAATLLQLEHQPSTSWHVWLTPDAVAPSAIKPQEISRSIDKQQTLHVRWQETYQGYMVWGGEALMHVNKGKAVTVEGDWYSDLAADLITDPRTLVTNSKITAVQHYAKTLYQSSVDPKVQLIVFIDKSHKAHWAYQVSFTVLPSDTHVFPAKPVYLLDAESMQIYLHWNEIKTAVTSVETWGGGFGGNTKIGKLIYDGLQGHLAKLRIRRDEANQCYFLNERIIIRDFHSGKIIQFACNLPDSRYNNVYWSGDLDASNGGYSPSNDALFAGAMLVNMYESWYGQPVLVDSNGKPMLLTMRVHANVDNAYWDGERMTFGDGIDQFYPLTSLGVAAHEISHGFTEQHANLIYTGQSGGMNEAFSDMAAQAAEAFVYGQSSWQIGAEIVKKPHTALRYMDKPSKDCAGGIPGEYCSIDHVSQYYEGMDVHFSSGVYNRFFYLLSKSTGWDVQKAFAVMVAANANYWTRTTNFTRGACGVVKAATQLGFAVTAIHKAFRTVGIDSHAC